MKVLLLSSPVVQPDFDRIARLPNLGLASLAAHVDDLCTVHVADIHGLKGHRDYVEKLAPGYDLVGLTAMSFQYQEALVLARIAKEAGAETVFGGYHPTLAAEEIGRRAGLNFVYAGNIPGEGENTTCPACGETLVERFGFRVARNGIVEGKCPSCGEGIPGVW
jgi:predicted RNA-binding Zn-ribbon protein involved in translation (DUF1610 family)